MCGSQQLEHVLGALAHVARAQYGQTAGALWPWAVQGMRCGLTYSVRRPLAEPPVGEQVAPALLGHQYFRIRMA
jgi:hypothetical protein